VVKLSGDEPFKLRNLYDAHFEESTGRALSYATRRQWQLASTACRRIDFMVFKPCVKRKAEHQALSHWSG
jgi:hypothetical protein